ncbi:hypothetical protein PAECIP111802_06536 [Paenibacillus allorhizosphaerae]|uniref:Uncharacterized protein n=1 Tax=Paenibacillus allorhizosphaerae TaxID=2849866 RepID=A0ABN7TZL4_9BACL|nr:hypothetical protein PAECIP111802_06536 [Paenibacillus allorhizosphaerae]
MICNGKTLLNVGTRSINRLRFTEHYNIWSGVAILCKSVIMYLKSKKVKVNLLLFWRLN